jgi:arabinose-5-phosphate isomerase
MLTAEQIPVIAIDCTLAEAVTVLNERNLGAVLVMAGEDLLGIITDGDIRRLVSRGDTLAMRTIAEVMTRAPKTIDEQLLAADALSIMQRHEITFLPVHNLAGHLVGALHLQDLLGKGEFRFMV